MLTGVHHQAAGAVLEALDAAPEGLSEAEAGRRLSRYGPNRLPEEPRRHPVWRLVARFDNVLVLVLIGAAVVTAALQHWTDTAVILGVVLGNAGIGFVQEGRAEAAMSAIRDMLPVQATVLRDGRRQTRSADALVPGDIVLVEAGDRVPADLRLLQAHALSAQEAALTGESVPAAKSALPAGAVAALGDRHSMLWSGTTITQGSARGVVAATGRATEIGRIGGLLAGIEPLSTPLVRQMDRFARWLSQIILGVAGLLLAYGTLMREDPFAEVFMAVVGIAVAAIPEGLPAVMTITLALAQTMVMNMLVILEVFHLFYIRNLHGTSLRWSMVRATPVVWSVVAAIVAAQLAVTYLPPLQVLLGTAAIPLQDGAVLLAIGIAFFALIESEKQVRLRLRSF